MSPKTPDAVFANIGSEKEPPAKMWANALETIDNKAHTPFSERAFQFWHNPNSSSYSLYTHMSIVVLIAISVLLFLLQSLPSLDPDRVIDPDEAAFLDDLWTVCETFCIAVFTLEYGCKLITAPRKWEFVKDVMNVIDVVAIVPFYVQLLIQWWSQGSSDQLSAVLLLRVLRLFRVFRILKLGKYFGTLTVVVETMKRSGTALFTLLFIAGLGTILFSAAIYYAEGVGFTDHRFCYREDEPKKLVPESDDNYDYCSGFSSIPASMWWTLITMCTVGYGDVSPKTASGKLIGTICALSGILSLALPITVVGANFTDIYEEHLNATKKTFNIGRYSKSIMLRELTSIEVDVVGRSTILNDLQHTWRLSENAAQERWLRACKLVILERQRLVNPHLFEKETKEMKDQARRFNATSSDTKSAPRSTSQGIQMTALGKSALENGDESPFQAACSGIEALVLQAQALSGISMTVVCCSSTGQVVTITPPPQASSSAGSRPKSSAPFVPSLTSINDIYPAIDPFDEIAQESGNSQTPLIESSY